MDAEKRDAFLSELADLCKRHQIVLKADADDGGGTSALFISLEEYHPFDIDKEVAYMLEDIGK